MANLNIESILDKTHYGLNIYSHILREYYGEEFSLKLKGRDCGLTRNPFNKGNKSLHIFIEKDTKLNTVFDDEVARHHDTQNAVPDGTAISFAKLHYKLDGDELLQKINSELNLRIGENVSFYANQRQEIPLPVPVANASEQVQSQTALTPHASREAKSPEGSFSFYKSPITNTSPSHTVTLEGAYKYITGKYAKERTEKLRSITDSKKARFYKAQNFDYCTFSGTFTNRNDKALINHSGLLCIDFDDLQNLDLLRKQLLQDEYFETHLLFTSPSGNGLKWIIQIKNLSGFQSELSHAEIFTSISTYITLNYQVEVDKSGKDVSRACFLSYDPDAYINPIYLNS